MSLNNFRLIILLLAVFSLCHNKVFADCGADVPCSAEATAAPNIIVDEIKYEEMLRLYTSGEKFFLLDVRPKTNFDQEHIKNAVNLTVGQASEEQISAVLPDKNAYIVVYCAGSTCPMSRNAAIRLKMLGYMHVVDYNGGYAEWKNMNQPVESAMIPDTVINP